MPVKQAGTSRFTKTVCGFNNGMIELFPIWMYDKKTLKELDRSESSRGKRRSRKRIRQAAEEFNAAEERRSSCRETRTRLTILFRMRGPMASALHKNI